jgi:hypothetical protein
MTEWGIGSLFNPGQRHVEEEKRRLQSTREEVGDSSGGKRIDLDLGKVVIQKKAQSDAADDAVEDEPLVDGAAATDGTED